MKRKGKKKEEKEGSDGEFYREKVKIARQEKRNKREKKKKRNKREKKKIKKRKHKKLSTSYISPFTLSQKFCEPTC